ncbi:2-nitropropane dioxygenase [Chlorella sorokiniana]|uniref:2-nitropropane dioxygenase n=1 Tax=Chlorella sorokiniana TaxID=3076 RepID=A0A2P6TFC0_CHLSO|nr:2-nitropropane dioxygenase [Chlorella sorokiniana]|eukprot:PRW32672.1 2-nitropropane dioxygenase [Chlorella sorokiniana]
MYGTRPDSRVQSWILPLLPSMLLVPQLADLVLLSCKGAARGGLPTVNMRILGLLLDMTRSSEHREFHSLDKAMRAAARRLQQCTCAGLLAAPEAAIHALLSSNTSDDPLIAAGGAAQPGACY